MTTLETVPAEVLHAICSLLPSKDVAAARRTSKVLAEIGAHHLVRQVTFYTSEASLDRLQKVAEHNVFRLYVGTVHFEANLLANLCCRPCWLERFAKPGHGVRAQRLEKPKALPEPSTVREKRVYARNLQKWEEDVNKAYDDHHNLREEQQRLHQQSPELMAQIIPRFPRLQKITVTIGRCQHALSKRFQQDFDRRLGFCPPLSIDTGSTASQVKHLVLPGGNSLRDLQSLVVSDLDPSLFDLASGPCIMHQAFTNLKKLDLTFRLPDRVEPRTDPGLYNDLKRGGLRSAIASALNLEDLRIAFNDFAYDGPCIDLNDVLGTKGFDHLKKLSISYAEADANDFIEILKRQKVLKHLAIYSVSIKGSWVDVLDEMQKDLSLKHATFDGFLADTDALYDMECAEVDRYMVYLEEFTIGMAMQMYVTSADDDDEPNPLSTFYDEYADRETLDEMHAEMVAGMSEDCDCDRCIEAMGDSEYEGFDDDNLDNDDDDDDDDSSMPDLDRAEDVDLEAPSAIDASLPD